MYVSGRCEAISKTDQKKNLLLKASSFLCGGVCTYICISICISVVNVNLSGLFFLSPTRITLKTERLGIGEPCGGWVVCRSGRVGRFQPRRSQPMSPPGPSKFTFLVFCLTDGALSGKTGLCTSSFLFFFLGVVLSFSWRSVLYSSDLGSRPVPQKLRLN